MATEAVHHDAGHAEGEHGHGHVPFLAHHFDSMEQQSASGKLGMWAFLATELLMFGGLFCAYAVYRHNHPEVFLFAHTYLNKTLGGVNTAILIASSFTMAWGVRAAQLGQRTLLRVLLVLTFMGGVGFLCIKYVEYKAKWEHYLFPGQYNAFNVANTTQPYKKDIALEYWKEDAAKEDAHPANKAGAEEGKDFGEHLAGPTTMALNPGYADPHKGTGDEAKLFAKYVQPVGLRPELAESHHVEYAQLDPLSQQRVNTFFGVYFVMTGLHGIHVLVGMGIIAWLFFTSGRYSPAYNAPVDIGGLYWHLVDLIWIFLFPLLYLIHGAH